LVLASQARREIADSGRTVGGAGLATAATVISIVDFALVGLAVLAIIANTFLGTSASVHYSNVTGNLSVVRFGLP
jgi:hypothetical protein